MTSADTSAILDRNGDIINQRVVSPDDRLRVEAILDARLTKLVALAEGCHMTSQSSHLEFYAAFAEADFELMSQATLLRLFRFGRRHLSAPLISEGLDIVTILANAWNASCICKDGEFPHKAEELSLLSKLESFEERHAENDSEAQEHLRLEWAREDLINLDSLGKHRPDLLQSLAAICGLPISPSSSSLDALQCLLNALRSSPKSSDAPKDLSKADVKISNGLGQRSSLSGHFLKVDKVGMMLLPAVASRASSATPQKAKILR